MVCFPEMRRGGVGLCVATLLAGCMKPGAAASGWNAPEIAWGQKSCDLIAVVTFVMWGEWADNICRREQMRKWHRNSIRRGSGRSPLMNRRLSAEGAPRRWRGMDRYPHAAYLSDRP